MIPHRVALLHHALYHVRSGLQKMSHHKESARRIVLFQGVQNRRRVSVFITAVKGEIDHLLVAASHKISVIPQEVFGGSISCGGSA